MTSDVGQRVFVLVGDGRGWRSWGKTAAAPDVYVGHIDLDVVHDTLHQVLHKSFLRYGTPKN